MEQNDQYHVLLARRDRSKNMARFYELAIEHGLFGEVLITRRWGRIGSTGQSKSEPVGNTVAGLVIMLELLKAKRRRGYAPVVGGCSH